jgi:ketosteroid isomerase-like protein
MKALLFLFIGVLAVCGSLAQSSGTAADRAGLLRTTTAIRNAFGRGDIEGILLLHHPDVIKYFGGTTVIKGREGLRQQLSGWLGNNKVEFLENTVESTVFNGSTAIETSLYTIKSVPKNGDPPVFARGRAMVVFVKYPASPTGWVSLREVTQEAPPK